MILKIALIALVCISPSACSRNVIIDDTTEVAAVEAKTWPKCNDLSQRTVYDEFFQSEEFAKRLLTAGRLSSVTEELEASRERFLETGDLVEIFPLLLFYETRESLDFAMKPRIKHKIEFLNIVLNTYDAYKANREAFDRGEPDSVDRQWRSYFNAAKNAQAGGVGVWTPEDGVDVLLEGVNAHFLNDLPRATREVVKKSSSDRNVLTEDFMSADVIYPIAEENAKKDILERFKTGADIERVQKLFGNGAEYVKFSRQKAWEMGVGDGPLGTLEKQPHFAHDGSNRKYFPEELMARGICR